MLNWIEYLKLHCMKPVKPVDDVITVSRQDAVQLNRVGIGNYMYLTLRLYGYENNSEVVRYMHTADIASTGSNTVDVAVSRDMGGSGRKAFPVHTCAIAELGKLQLTEIIQQVMEGAQ